MWNRLDNDLAVLLKLLTSVRIHAILYQDIGFYSSQIASTHIRRRISRDMMRVHAARRAVQRIRQSPLVVQTDAVQLLNFAEALIRSNNAPVRSAGDKTPETTVHPRCALTLHYADPSQIVLARVLQELARSCIAQLLRQPQDTSPTSLLILASRIVNCDIHPPLHNKNIEVKEKLTNIAHNYPAAEHSNHIIAALRHREVTWAIISSSISAIALMLIAVIILNPKVASETIFLILAGGILLERTLTSTRLSLLGCPNTAAHFSDKIDVSGFIDRTTIAVPVLLGSESQVVDLLAIVDANAKAQPAVTIALLTDFPDADSPVDTPYEKTLLRRVTSGLKRLTEAHGNRFCLLHRDRTWSATQRCFMGHDRKRGKIDALNSFINDGKHRDISFEWGVIEKLKATMFVLVLDEDSQVDINTVSRLLRARQQRLAMKDSQESVALIYCPSHYVRPRTIIGMGPFVTPFVALSPKDRSLSFDVLGECVYTGKGLYSVEEYQGALSGRIASESVLSHDTVEGSWLKPAFVSDALISEGFPATFQSLLARSHRWSRGDFLNSLLLVRQLIRGEMHPFGPSRAARIYLAYMLICRASVLVMPFVLLASLDSKHAPYGATLPLLALFIIGPGLLAHIISILRGQYFGKVALIIRLQSLPKIIVLAGAALIMSLSRSISTADAAFRSGIAFALNHRRLDWIPTSHSRGTEELSRLALTILLPWAFVLLVSGRPNFAQVLLMIIWVIWQLVVMAQSDK